VIFSVQPQRLPCILHAESLKFQLIETVLRGESDVPTKQQSKRSVTLRYHNEIVE